MKTLKNRLYSIWLLLTSRNFILLHHCQDWTNEEGKSGFTVGVQRRTDFTAKRDFYIIAGAIRVAFNGVHLHIPDEIDEQFFDANGKFQTVKQELK